MIYLLIFCTIGRKTNQFTVAPSCNDRKYFIGSWPQGSSLATFTDGASGQNRPTGGGKQFCFHAAEPQFTSFLSVSSTLLPTEDQQCVFHTTMCRSVCSGMRGITPPPPPAHRAHSLTHSHNNNTYTYMNGPSLKPRANANFLPPSPQLRLLLLLLSSLLLLYHHVVVDSAD